MDQMQPEPMRKTPGTTVAQLATALSRPTRLASQEVIRLIRSVGRSEETLDREIGEAFDALSKSSQLIENLEQTLKDRPQKLLNLPAEYKRVSELSNLTQDQANAIANSLEILLGQSASRERFFSFFISITTNVLVFLVGVFASDWVKALGHALHH